MKHKGKVKLNLKRDNIELDIPCYMNDEAINAKERITEGRTQVQIMNDIKNLCDKLIKEDCAYSAESIEYMIEIALNALSSLQIQDNFILSLLEENKSRKTND